MASEHPRVFISYSHDSEEHKDRVLQLAHKLRGDGMDARLDQFVNGTPPEGWPRWMRNQIKQAQFVLVVCTETYRRRAEREEKPGRGHGVIYESLIAEADIYANGSKNTKFIPVYFKGSSSKNVPDFLQTWTYYPITKLSEYETLRRVLTDQPLTPMPPLGKGATLPPKMVGDLFEDAHMAKADPHLAPAPFTVCILATKGDLAEIQAKTALHLEATLGMKTIAAPEDPDASLPQADGYVLLLAWRWENGRAIALWQKADPAKRTAFLIAPDASWDVSLMEMPQWQHIDQFRKSLDRQQITYFETTASLPDQVGQWAVKRRDAHRGDDQHRGLSAGELAYLKQMIPFWHHARTETAGTSGFYDPDRYVSLDGEASGWQLNEQGRIEPIPKSNQEPTADNEMPLEREASKLLRLPLDQWATAANLPALVISGQPGSGKTVFLTRLAKTLALAHTEPQAVSPENMANLTQIQNDRGQWPIPVLLEAKQLVPQNAQADYNHLCQAVGEAVLEDVACMQSRLTHGRYWLLLDALDEIASDDTRQQVLQLLKGFMARTPGCRMIITTRAARYTGVMPFGPEFQVIELADMNQAQRDVFCERFCETKGCSGAFLKRMQAALSDLEQRHHGGESHEALTANPLLLTAACDIYHTEMAFPDGRADLCKQLIDYLCRKNLASDQAYGLHLKKTDKMELLAHLALATQRANGPFLPVREACALVAQWIPSEEAWTHERRQRALTLLAQTTGLIYYVGHEEEGPQIRFHHRLFREYLAACALAKGDHTIKELIHDLLAKDYLLQAYWHDVMVLLPDALGSRTRMIAMARALRELAEDQELIPRQGRLLALLGDMVLEHRLTPSELGDTPLAPLISTRYGQHGTVWPLSDRLPLLRVLGRLGDPRPDIKSQDYWIAIEAGSFTMGDDSSEREWEKPAHQVQLSQAFWMARYPVTNSEFAVFMEEGGYKNRAYWCDESWAWLQCNDDRKLKAWVKQNDYRDWSLEWIRPDEAPRFWCSQYFNAPNQPVVGVSWYETRAYARWLNTKLQEGTPPLPHRIADVRLPTEAQWEKAAKGGAENDYPWGDSNPDSRDLANFSETKVGRTTPIGCFPMGATPLGLMDMAGNVWEWCCDHWDAKAYSQRKGAITNPLVKNDGPVRVLRGGSWDYGAYDLRCASRGRYLPAIRFDNVGFRLCGCRPEHDS